MTRCLVITGPTASGKTRLAVELARRFNGEIVGADSRQVFRGMDIGTGKDLAEYSEGGAAVPYHLIDVVDPGDDFHLFKYLELARDAIGGIAARGRLPVVAGGTPLYIKALLEGYDQEGGAPDPELRSSLEAKSTDELLGILGREADERLYRRTDKTQRRRIIRSIELARNGATVTPEPIIGDSLVLAPFYDRKTIHERIRMRLEERLANGMVDEVRRLHAEGLSWERMEWLGLEYRYIARMLEGRLDEASVREQLLARIRQFCKHQDGWFRHFERDGWKIHWIRGGDVEEAAGLVGKWLGGQELPEPAIRLDDIRYGSN